MIFVVSKFLSPADCQRLRAIYEEGLRRGRFRPEGTTHSTVIGLEYVTREEPFAHLYKEVGARLREQFSLPPLGLDYYAYTRMLPGSSHPLHADALTLDGRPNHTPYRVASAMVYLSESNLDFGGGWLQFPKLGVKVRERVGLMTGFLTDLEYQHTVPEVTWGVRDALAIWFRRADRPPVPAPAKDREMYGVETK